MSAVDQCRISIPSDTAKGQEVQERIVGELERREYPPRDIFGMRLSLEEGIINAIKHGNRNDPQKSVHIEWYISDEKVRVEIEDEGAGFRPEDVPDPTLEENLERPSGRGIMLMKAFLTLVEYNDRGNRLVLEKIRGVDPPGHDD